jgi:hypothetical protein
LNQPPSTTTWTIVLREGTYKGDGQVEIQIRDKKRFLIYFEVKKKKLCSSSFVNLSCARTVAWRLNVMERAISSILRGWVVEERWKSPEMADQ